MNNDKLKGTNSSFSTTGRRPSATGKLKLPKKQIQSVGTLSKKPFLKEYSLAMESKLQSLKEKISQKKKQKPLQQQSIKAQKSSTQIQNFLKPKTTKQTTKQFQQKLIISQLEQFLAQNNMLIYKSLLLENHIDSLQILAEATQKELEEIGIPKGHALKLKVNINKLMSAKRPGTEEKGKINVRQNRTKDTDRNKSFLSATNNKESQQKSQTVNNLTNQLQSICIGTQQDGMQSITFINNTNVGIKRKNKFCLFCYQSIKQEQNQHALQFCSQDCLDRYNQMFKTYENNLIKAQQEFKKDTKNQQSNDQNQQQNLEQNDQFDLFDQIEEGYEDFDYESYEQLKKKLSGL